ncbi:unnamed protein product [Lymnaea stagnalis]|uniref:Uncharacterized protein n=1 Tax=Lymnaea stagnalis TaxID=6523 RepID=A0AAV2HPQ3_LYMST
MRYLLGVALLNMVVAGTNGQLTAAESMGDVFFYSTPIYCTTLVPQLQTCPPQPCFASNTRGQCCMGIYRSTTGALYQQCKCNNNINCNTYPPVGGPSATRTPPPTTSTPPPTTSTPPPTTNTRRTTRAARTTTAAPFFHDMPQYCSAVTADMPKFCLVPDPCYSSTTRASCCLTLSRQFLIDAPGLIAYLPQCRCSASVGTCEQNVQG